MMNGFDSFSVGRIPPSTGKEYIRKNHYTKTCHNGPTACYGLFTDSRNGISSPIPELVGVVVFSCPCSENVRSSVFGEEYKDSVTELSRLHVQDSCGKNTESWFVSRAIRLLKMDNPNLKAIISFADSTEGHVGYIYQALNFLYCGQTSSTTFYRDENGRLRHPRQSGVNITREMARDRGWTPERRAGKHRYLFLLDKKWRKKVRIQTFSTEFFPKGVDSKPDT